MAFWCLLKPSQVKNISNQLKRCYSQLHGSLLANPTALHGRTLVFPNTTLIVADGRQEFVKIVRFYAAPVKAKSKQEVDPTGPRLNEKIPADFVRLVTDQGHEVVPRHVALARARHFKLDLVEVQRNAKPPVCKIMDYHKEKYKQEVKEKERSKSKCDVILRKGDLKEVRFATKIEQKDLQMKADMAKRLMERGYRVKCMAMGSEDQDLGGLLSRFSALIEDAAVIENGPRMEKKQAYVVVRHSKFGPLKKGPGKKNSKLDASSTDGQKAVASSSNHLNGEESGLETDGSILSEDNSIELVDDREKQKSSWSAFGKEEDYDKCFDLKNDNVQCLTSEHVNNPAPAPAPAPAPICNSERMHEVSSIPSASPLGRENRCQREPRNRLDPGRSMNVESHGARDSTRVQHQHLNQTRHPQLGRNVPSPTREKNRVETDASNIRNMKFAPRFPASNRTYSNPKTDDCSLPGRNERPAEVNRYKKATPSSYPRNPLPEN